MIRRLPLTVPYIYRNHYNRPLYPPDLKSWAVAYGWLRKDALKGIKGIKYCLKRPRWFVKSLIGTVLYRLGWRFKNGYAKTSKNGFTCIHNFLPKKQLNYMPVAYYG